MLLLRILLGYKHLLGRSKNPETAYDYPGRRWFEFPASENGEEYRKVLCIIILSALRMGQLEI